MHDGRMTKDDGTAVRTAGREGFALVTAVLVVLVLSVLAVGVAWIAGTEKKTTHAESVRVRSLFAADAGGEAGINFIRTSDSPPLVVSWADNLVRAQGQTVLDGSQSYAYRAQSLGPPRPKAGWGIGYYDFDYRLAADGQSSRDGRASVDVVVSRLYKLGY